MGTSPLPVVPPTPFFDPSGKVRMVPNHLIKDALRSGGEEAVQIVDPKGVKRWAPKSKLRQYLSAGAKVAPPPAPKPQGSSVYNFFSSFAAPFISTAEGIYHAATAPPEGTAEKATNLLGPVALFIKRSVVDPAIEQGKETVASVEAARKEKNPYRRHMDESEAVGHGLATVTPMYGPWWANVGDKVGTQAGEGNYAGAVGTLAGNVALAEVPKVAGRVVPPAFRAGVDAVRRGLKGEADISPLDIRKTAQRTVEANRDAADAAAKANKENTHEYEKKSSEATHETQGRELARRHSVRTKAEEIAAKDAAEAAKLRIGHDKELREAREHNERVKAKHTAVAKRIQEENAARESTLKLRQQKEAELQKATDAYRAQEEATDARAKAQENQAWSGWRAKMKDATLDGKEIAEPLEKLRLDSPEVDRTLNQLEPRGDEVPQESPFARLRDQTAQSNFGAGYDSLSPVRQDAVDTIMLRAGESPDPISFDPMEGQQISVERVQRASSILQRYIRSGRFEGPLLGEMKQVAKVLRRAVTKASEEHGAADDLDQARAETVRYNEAFGRERPEPRTVRGEREKTANPEEVKRLQEEERLEAARKHDPSLAEAQEKVRAARDELKKLPSEEALRKANRQVPTAPSVNHPLEAYRLKSEPEAPPQRLTSGSPQERADQQTPLVERATPPARKPEIVPDVRSLSPEQISSEQAEKLREIGLKKKHQGPLGHLLTGGISTWALAEALRGEWHYAAALGAARVLLSLPTEGIGRLLTNERIVEWVSKPTKSELSVYEGLSPDQKAVFGEGLQRLASVAKQKGIHVSPKWMAVGSIGQSRPPRHPVFSAKSPLNGRKYTHNATNPQGHRIGSNDGQTWYDVQSGQQVQ